MIDDFPAHLFGRHIADGADHHAGTGQPSLLGLVLVARDLVGTEELGQPEIEKLEPPVRENEDVFWFQIAMNDPLVMRCRQAAGDLHGVLDGLFDSDTGSEVFAQGLPFQQLGDDER